MKHSSLKRKAKLESRTPIRKHRTKARPGRIKGDAMAALRHEVFIAFGGRCVDCGIDLIEFPASIFLRRAYHMSHRRNRRMWGDSLENCQAKCSHCHLVKEHSYGPSGEKPCPPKN